MNRLKKEIRGDTGIPLIPFISVKKEGAALSIPVTFFKLVM